MQPNEHRDWAGCEIVEFDPEKLGGAPTVRGRRITPDAFVDNFNGGLSYTPEYIAQELFDEPVEDVRLILRYADQKGWLSRPFR